MSRFQGWDTGKNEFKGINRAAINKSTISGWFDIVTPYNKRFVEELKNAIPGSQRRWKPEEKVWQIHELYLDKTVELLKRFFDEVTTNIFNNDDEPTIDNLFVPLFDILPDDTIDKVYTSLARALHPDVGGNAEQMSKLNQAYQAKRGH